MTPGKAITMRGTLSVQMTAQDIISLAVNVVQNGRSLDDLGCGSAEDSVALRQMLAEVYDHILATYSQTASRLPYKPRL
jgi:precorrin-6B methylase 2